MAYVRTYQQSGSNLFVTVTTLFSGLDVLCCTAKLLSQAFLCLVKTGSRVVVVCVRMDMRLAGVRDIAGVSWDLAGLYCFAPIQIIESYVSNSHIGFDPDYECH